MQLGMRSIAKEVGTALAVLAMYLLVLLAPWHQANALQHDFAELGYVSAETVDICAPASPHGGDTDHAEIKCPAAGVGKSDFVFAEPASIVLPAVPVAQAAVYPADPAVAEIGIAPHVAQARAPPVTV
jgi:hypothetical protein